MIKEAIIKLSQHNDLSFKETETVFEEIFDNSATPSQIAAFLAVLKMKGEKEEEIWAAAKFIREKAHKLNVRDKFLDIEDNEEPVIDTCGTGGSGINKFNISTAAAFVVSSAGVKVAKHGNRAMSSNCGSADVLEAMGIKVDVPPAIMENIIKKIGIGFLYAPLYHPALRQVAGIRREIGIRTIFNILGPLCNPALATYQLLGVYREDLIPVISRVLKDLGVKSAFVICSRDLKDEVSLSSKTEVAFLRNKRIENFSLTASDFGIKRISLDSLLVNNSQESALRIFSVLKGEKGACRDIVLANAACCFYILGKVKNLKDGVKLAAGLIDGHKAEQKFMEFKNILGEVSTN